MGYEETVTFDTLSYVISNYSCEFHFGHLFNLAFKMVYLGTSKF